MVGSLLLGGGSPTTLRDLEPKLMPFVDTGAHSGQIRQMVFSRRTDLLYTVADDYTARIWNVQTGALMRTLHFRSSPARKAKLFTLALSPDEKHLAVAGWGSDRAGLIQVVDLDTDAVTELAVANNDSVSRVAFVGNDEVVAFNHVGQGQLWKVSNASLVRDFDYRKYQRDSAPYHFAPLAVGEDGKAFAVAGPPRDGQSTVVRWAVDGSGGTATRVPGAVASLKWAAGKVLAAMEDGHAYEVEGSGATEVAPVPARGMSAWAEAAPIFASVNRDNTRAAVKEADGTTSEFAVEGDLTAAVALSGTGDRLAIADVSNHIRFYDTKRKGQASENVVSTGPVMVVQCSRAGDRVAFGSGEQPTMAFDFDQMREIRLEAADFAGTAELAPERSGDEAVAWTLAGGRTVKVRMESRDEVPKSATVSGDYLLVCTNFNVLVYDLRGNGVLRAVAWLVGTGSPVQSVSLSATAGRVATGALDGSVCLWDLPKDLTRLSREWPTAVTPRVSLVREADGNWVAWESHGYYATSPGGSSDFGWQDSARTGQLATVYPAAVYEATFDRPDVMRRLLATKSIEEAVRDANREWEHKVTFGNLLGTKKLSEDHLNQLAKVEDLRIRLEGARAAAAAHRKADAASGGDPSPDIDSPQGNASRTSRQDVLDAEVVYLQREYQEAKRILKVADARCHMAPKEVEAVTNPEAKISLVGQNASEGDRHLSFRIEGVADPDATYVVLVDGRAVTGLQPKPLGGRSTFEVDLPDDHLGHSVQAQVTTSQTVVAPLDTVRRGTEPTTYVPPPLVPPSRVFFIGLAANGTVESTLKSPEDDVRDLLKTFQALKDKGRYATVIPKLLLASEGNFSLQSVADAVTEFRKMNLQPEDMLVLATAGHGTMLPGSTARFYIEGLNWDLAKAETTGIPGDRLINYVTEPLDSDAALPWRPLVLIDTCHAAANKTFPRENLAAIFSACEQDEAANESMSQWKGGVFMQSVIEYLDKPTQPGMITLYHMVHDVGDAVVKRTRENQHPTLVSQSQKVAPSKFVIYNNN